MARGDGPCASNVLGARNELDDGAPGENRLSGLLKPTVGEVAGGLVAPVLVLAPGVATATGLPELNSAHLGHLRFVSAKSQMIRREG